MNISEKYKSLFSFIFSEQKLTNLEYYDSKSAESFQADLPSEYLPINSNIFRLPFFAIPLDSPYLLSRIRSSHIDFIASNIRLDINGNNYYPFFIHPSTETFFLEIMPKDLKYIIQSESCFYATPTSSFRTLLVWRESENFSPFFVKVSLLINLANGSRHIDWFSALGQFESSAVTFNCMGENTNITLFNDIAAIGVKLDEEYVLPESCITHFGPRNLSAFGTVIREIPRAILSNEKKAASFVSLTSLRRSPLPWLVHISESSGIKYDAYLREKVIYPLLKDLLYLVNTHGVGIEPHCQNVMAELTNNGELTGKFYYRDFDVTGIDRARFPFLYREKWNEYCAGRPHRLSRTENTGDRLGIAGVFYYHFHNLLFPCIKAGLATGAINEVQSNSLFAEVDKYWMDSFNSSHPFFKDDFIFHSDESLPAIKPLIRTHISEIPCSKAITAEIPDIRSYQIIFLGKEDTLRSLSSASIYSTSTKDFIICNDVGQVEAILLRN